MFTLFPAPVLERGGGVEYTWKGEGPAWRGRRGGAVEQNVNELSLQGRYWSSYQNTASE